ncbi:hypothetical protein Bhyg_07625, partial [Pseudolycoriella hygida]
FETESENEAENSRHDMSVELETDSEKETENVQQNMSVEFETESENEAENAHQGMSVEFETESENERENAHPKNSVEVCLKNTGNLTENICRSIPDDDKQLCGRRIVDIDHLFNQMRNLTKNVCNECDE